ncbi:Pyoverdine/dityrosine biosynthesis protein-domain-containing protein [Phycomyces nitens]|nr:Pyoverdine/dityrosine biosynthesis protein-domain-containing protein [Phycomyces nitens]
MSYKQGCKDTYHEQSMDLDTKGSNNGFLGRSFFYSQFKQMLSLFQKKDGSEQSSLGELPVLSPSTSTSSSSPVLTLEDTIIDECNTPDRCGHVLQSFLDHFDTAIRYHSLPSLDCYSDSGKYALARKIHPFICALEPILMVLPAFPCKSPNSRDKVLGVLPDCTEEIGLLRIENFCRDVEQYYPQGCQLTIVSDGRVFADLVGVKDELVTVYNDFLEFKLFKSRGGLEHIVFKSLDDHLAAINTDDLAVGQTTENWGIHDQRRAGLMEIFTDADKAETISNKMVNLGFVRYLEEDLMWATDISKTRKKKECRQIARKMMERNVAFSRLCEHHYPTHLRLSIHGYNSSGPKFPIQIAPNLRGPTPWHSVCLEFKDGKKAFVKRKIATRLVQDGHFELYEHPEFKRPWGFRQLDSSHIDMESVLAESS